MALHIAIGGRVTLSAGPRILHGGAFRVPSCVKYGAQLRQRNICYCPSYTTTAPWISNTTHRDTRRKDDLVICNHRLLGPSQATPTGERSTTGYDLRGVIQLSPSRERDSSIFCQFPAHSYLPVAPVHTCVNVAPSERVDSGLHRVGISDFAVTHTPTFLSHAQRPPQYVWVRSFHTTPSGWEEAKSKVQETVKALKDEAKVKTLTSKPDITLEQKPAAGASPEIPAAPLAGPPAPSTAVVKPSLWQRVVAEVKHYYHGFRLLFIEVKICSKYIWRLLNGKNLTRRERKQLVRTTADLFRLVPFSVFIIVPFMEFLLPVALKLFPSMLPSTFKADDKEQEKFRKNLKGKLEMAKFLQDTIEEMALENRGTTDPSQKVTEFKEFMARIRSSGTSATNEEILRYSKLFKDELTLDNLQFSQLNALCKLLELKTFGARTSTFLRFQLRLKLRQLEYDDRMILREGIDALTVWELQEACRSRGMRALGVPEARLRAQLQDWLVLHLDAEVPVSLLLLSRTLYMPESVSATEQLKATLSTLPDTTTEEAKVKISEVSGERVDNRVKLELLRQEEEAIKKEKEEVKATIAKAPEVPATPVTKPSVEPAEAAAVVEEASAPKPEEILVDKAPVVEEPTVEGVSARDLEEIEEVLEHVAEERMTMKLEQDEFKTLKEDVSDYQENLADLKQVIVSTGGNEKDIQESKAAQRLSKRVTRMIGQMDDVLGNLFREKEALMEDIEIKEVKMRRSSELQNDEDRRQDMMDLISEKKRNLVSINEVVLGMKRLQKVSDDTRIQRIMQVLDEDSDGVIDINDALKVIELLGRENVMVDKAQMTEILSLLRNETDLQEDEKMKTMEKMADEGGLDDAKMEEKKTEDVVKQ